MRRCSMIVITRRAREKKKKEIPRLIVCIERDDDKSSSCSSIEIQWKMSVVWIDSSSRKKEKEKVIDRLEQ